VLFVLLDCFAPMRWLRARGLLRVGVASLRVIVFCFVSVWPMASRQVLGLRA
jgi:hypothetical protein